MRRNIDLINRSGLLATIVEKIERTYPEDVSLLICYGSYVTGDHGPMSDIDFFFVPKTKKGYRLGHQFILNDIGYDLWPVSWERLASISNLEEQLASILMDGEILFAASEEDTLKLEDLRKKLQQNLQDVSRTRKMSLKYIDRAKRIYFDMQTQEGSALLIDAVEVAETLLFAIAIMNGTYTGKGLKRIEAEIDGFSIKPSRFLENYARLIRTDRKAEVQHLVNELIGETEGIWNTKYEQDKKSLDSSDLAGFYEEFKSTYNKLFRACDEKNYETAYYAAFMIDRETRSFLTGFAGRGTFPGMTKAVLKNDFENLRARCIEHEQQLIKLLKRNHIEINIYGDMKEFRQFFLEKGT